MKVYVVRHGQSETNLAGKWTGWLDVHLTKGGREDARRVGALLQGIAFDRIYTSDLSRAVETAETALPDCSYETSPLLREINVGELAGQPIAALTDAQRASLAGGYSAFGGESRKEFCARIAQFQAQLEALDCDTVAVFSHAGWLRGLLDAVLETHLSGKHVCCNNCTLAIFEYTDHAWRLYSWFNGFKCT